MVVSREDFCKEYAVAMECQAAKLSSDRRDQGSLIAFDWPCLFLVLHRYTLALASSAQVSISARSNRGSDSLDRPSEVR